MTTTSTTTNCEYGYIYCVSNVSMPNIYNIGVSCITPERRLADINGLLGLWRPPTPYKCEFAKRVHNIECKKNAITKLLSQFRITSNREFFSVPLEDIKTLFDLMDGDYWIKDNIEKVDEVLADADINDMIDKNKLELAILNESFMKRKADIKIAEEKILDCIFKKSDNLEADLRKIEVRIANRKTELYEINDYIEERKALLANLTNDINTHCIANQYHRDLRDPPNNQILTEY